MGLRRRVGPQCFAGSAPYGNRCDCRRDLFLGDYSPDILSTPCSLPGDVPSPPPALLEFWQTSRQFFAIVTPQDPVSKASLLWTLTRCNFIDARMMTDRLIRSARDVSSLLSHGRGWTSSLPSEITTITARGWLRWICSASVPNRYPENQPKILDL
jgi:hypothetical protein